jgi:hypothetical protein
MKNRGWYLLGTLLIFASCAKSPEERFYSKAEVDRIADSLLALKLKELTEQAEQDLELRKKIELKYRIDSLKRVAEKE